MLKAPEKIKRWRIAALAVAAGFILLQEGVSAAEVRGEVRLRFSGGPGNGAPAYKTGIGIAVIPLQGQALPAARPRDYRIVIRNDRASPAYLLVHRRDRVKFVNKDHVFHEIYSRFALQPFNVWLTKSGSRGATRTVTFDYAGTWHIFCRIHDNMYARVDVMGTPYVRNLAGSGRFEFRGLLPGRWRLRITTIAGTVLTRDTRAFTAPPSLQIEVPVDRGGPVSPSAGSYRDSDIEALFPRE